MIKNKRIILPEKRIVILGAGFGGIYTAMHLEKYLKDLPGWEVVIINRENYFVYQPMLSEVVGGSVGITDTISSITRLAPKCRLINREIEGIDLEKKQVILSPKFTHAVEPLNYDQLVFALGNVTDFRNERGLHEHALPFKNLADSLRIRNHLIDVVETASVTKDPVLKKQLLTFVVGGGGFSGVEITAEINDFVKKMIDSKEIRIVLIHGKKRLMDKSLSESLSHYAEKLLKKRGVEILFERRLKIATPQTAILDNGEKIECQTIISTAPASANPIIESLPLPLEKGRLKTDRMMRVEGKSDIWALGDCAWIPLENGGICPQTAQFAVHQAKILAHNIAASILKKELKPFFFKSLGNLGALGHRSAFAELFGWLKLRGTLAWLLWRALYWIKLPGISRKIKVAFSWLLDAIFPLDPVQLKLSPSQGIAKLHFETGEVIFNEGDVGDYLYIITDGAVEVLKEKEGKIAELKKGEFFGEIALLNQRTRTATIRCTQPTDVLALRKSDFGVLIANFKELRETFEKVQKERQK